GWVGRGGRGARSGRLRRRRRRRRRSGGRLRLGHGHAGPNGGRGGEQAGEGDAHLRLSLTFQRVIKRDREGGSKTLRRLIYNYNLDSFNSVLGEHGEAVGRDVGETAAHLVDGELAVV